MPKSHPNSQECAPLDLPKCRLACCRQARRPRRKRVSLSLAGSCRRAPRSRSRLVPPHTPHFTDPESDLARTDASQISTPLPERPRQVLPPTRADEAGPPGVQNALVRAALPQPPCSPAHAALYRPRIGWAKELCGVRSEEWRSMPHVCRVCQHFIHLVCTKCSPAPSNCPKKCAARPRGEGLFIAKGGGDFFNLRARKSKFEPDLRSRPCTHAHTHTQAGAAL